MAVLFKEKATRRPRFLERKEAQHCKFAPYLIEIPGDKIYSHFRALLTIRRERFSTDLLTETTQIWGIGVPRVHDIHESWELLFFTGFAVNFFYFSLQVQPSPASNPAQFNQKPPLRP